MSAAQSRRVSTHRQGGERLQHSVHSGQAAVQVQLRNIFTRRRARCRKEQQQAAVEQLSRRPAGLTEGDESGGAWRRQLGVWWEQCSDACQHARAAAAHDSDGAAAGGRCKGEDSVCEGGEGAGAGLGAEEALQRSPHARLVVLLERWWYTAAERAPPQSEPQRRHELQYTLVHKFLLVGRADVVRPPL